MTTDTARASEPSGHLWLVGAGPGDPDWITVAGREALRRAEVVLYDRLAPSELLAEAPADALLIDVGKGENDAPVTQQQINELLIAHTAAGRRVVRLKGGDPYVFGRGGEEADAVAAAGLRCTVVPGITSAIGGLAAAGIPITHRGLAASFAVVTGHEDPAKPAEQVRWSRLATATDTLVVLMGVGRLPAIAAALLDGGRAGSTPCALVERAATAGQRVVRAPLDTIVAAAREAAIAPPTLLVVGAVAERTAAGGPLDGRTVLVTRTRQQASTLAAAIRTDGGWPLLLPALAITRRADAAAVAAAVTKLRAGHYGWVVYTSANAVRVWAACLREHGADARVFAAARLCAVGPGTADALRDHGLEPDLVPDEALAEAAATALIAAGAAGEGGGAAHVLWPRAEGARTVLADGLRRAGATVDDVPLYLAAPPAAPPTAALETVRAGRVDAVAFTSASTVRNLVTVLGPDIAALDGAVIACIGPITAQAARDAGLPVHVVADPHTVPGLVSALGRYCAGSEGAAQEGAAPDSAAGAPAPVQSLQETDR